MKGFYSIEEIFKSGFDAASGDMEREESWLMYRYGMLLEHEGLAVANAWIAEKRKMSKPENVKCPDCGGEMIPRNGTYGKFWGCKSFPKCRGTRDSEGRSKAERNADKNETMETPEKSDGVPWSFRKS